MLTLCCHFARLFFLARGGGTLCDGPLDPPADVFQFTCNAVSAVPCRAHLFSPHRRDFLDPVASGLRSFHNLADQLATPCDQGTPARLPESPPFDIHSGHDVHTVAMWSLSCLVLFTEGVPLGHLHGSGRQGRADARHLQLFSAAPTSQGSPVIHLALFVV